MSTGKRFKFQGSTIAVLSAYAAAKTISGITKAAPAVVTATAHGYSDGDVVKLSAIVGMTELNGTTWVIDNVTANTFELVDSDSTNYTTYGSAGDAQKATLSNFCELTGYNRQGGSSPEIDATSLCSTAAEFELGLPDYGTTQIDFNFAPQTTIQAAVKAYHLSGDPFAVKVVLPNSGGTMVQLGRVQQTSETAAKNGLWTGSLTLRNTGNRFDMA